MLCIDVIGHYSYTENQVRKVKVMKTKIKGTNKKQHFPVDWLNVFWKSAAAGDDWDSGEHATHTLSLSSRVGTGLFQLAKSVQCRLFFSCLLSIIYISTGDDCFLIEGDPLPCPNTHNPAPTLLPLKTYYENGYISIETEVNQQSCWFLVTMQYT